MSDADDQLGGSDDAYDKAPETEQTRKTPKRPEGDDGGVMEDDDLPSGG